MTLTVQKKEIDQEKTQSNESPSNLLSLQTGAKLTSELHERIGLKLSNSEEIDTRNLGFYYSIDHFNILLEENIQAENLSQPKIFNLPHAPKWCLGVINIRGIIIPVVNMHYLLKTNIDVSIKNTKLLLLKNERIEPIVIQVDQLPTMINLDNYTTDKDNKTLPEWAKDSLTNKSNTVTLKVDHYDLLSPLKNQY